MLGELKSAMALLAFTPDTPCKKYQRLFSVKRWDDLIQQFRQDNLSLYQLNSQSILLATLQAGLSALKTPQCYKPDEHNNQCPVCLDLFNKMANPLPFSHSSQSYLICRISGQPMNEHNPPMLLPNGYVYGEQALSSMSAENDGQVKCPRTGETFKFSDVKKVFVM